MAAKKKKEVDPGPPMAVKLGVTEDWVITAWDYEEEAWAHFIARKKGKQYELFEAGVESLEVEGRKGPVRAKTVDKLVDIVEEALAPEGEEHDEEDA